MPERPVIAVAWPKPDYLAAIERAGAEPRILTPEHDPLPASLDACDGVLLTGGEDVDPARYGAERHPTTKPLPVRDAYELEVLRLAFARDLPILGICRGAQLLNVAGGGTLFQDLPSERPEATGHAVRHTPNAPAHDIIVRRDTTLASLLPGARGGPVTVNSRHHQAVKDVAPGFVVSATAPDGIVEAIEKPSATFCVAVQWHPENFWSTGEFAPLFEGFVAAARAHHDRHARASRP